MNGKSGRKSHARTNILCGTIVKMLSRQGVLWTVFVEPCSIFLGFSRGCALLRAHRYFTELWLVLYRLFPVPAWGCL